MNFRARIAPAIVITALAACSKPEPPTLKPERATITQIGPTGIGVHLELTATNPNSVTVTAREVTAHIVLDGKYDLGTVTIPSAVALYAGKSSKIDVPLQLAWTDLAAMAELGAANRPVPYKVDGSLALGGDLLSVTVPFHLEGSVTHDEFMRATLNSLPQLPGLLNFPGSPPRQR